MNKHISRKTIHLIYGFFLILILYFDIYVLQILCFLFFIGFFLSLILKRKKVPVLSFFVSKVGRDYEHPGMGMILFTLGVFLTRIIFNKEIALAATLILTLIDSMGSVMGIKKGFIPLPGFKNKHLEGRLLSIYFSTILIFLSSGFRLIAIVIICFISVYIEALDIKIGKIKLDDNILLPIISGLLFFLSSLI